MIPGGRKGRFLIGSGIFVMAFFCVVVLYQSCSSSNASGGRMRQLALKAAAGEPDAVQRLQQLGHEAVPELVRLLQSRDSAVKRTLNSLGSRLARSRPMRRLGRWFMRQANLNAAQYRSAAATSLGLLGTQAEPAVGPLLKTLKDPDPSPRWEAAKALAGIGSASVDGLEQLLADPNPVVRQSAAYALGEMKEKAESAIPGLIAALSDTNADVRSSTSYSLAMIGFPSMLSLSNTIATGDPKAQDAAVNVLMRYRRELRKTIPALIQMSHSSSAASRAQALGSIGALRFADDASMRSVADGLKDNAVEVRLAAVKAVELMPWRLDTVRTELTNCLQDKSAEVRQEANKLLSQPYVTHETEAGPR